MDDALYAAFCATHYRFDSPAGELLLRVDVPSAALASLLRDQGADSMAVLSAFNPQAKRQDHPTNRGSQELLRCELAASGFTALQGRNEDPGGEWVEESFLVPGISLTEANALAAHHGQLAFLWCDAASATPRLLETQAPD